MTKPVSETGPSAGLPRGARICVAVALVLFGFAAYLLIVPLDVPTTTGAPFWCGTALAPLSGEFPRAACGALNDKTRLQAVLVAFVALVTLVAGFWIYGRGKVESPAGSDAVWAPGGSRR